MVIFYYILLTEWNTTMFKKAKKYLSYSALSVILAIMAYYIGNILFYILTEDTYSAEIIKTTYDKNGQLFITVKPDNKDNFNTDDKGNYKLEIKDIRIPILYWETKSERMDALTKGDTVCMTDVGWRFSGLSLYPIALDYIEGPCTQKTSNVQIPDSTKKAIK